MPPAARSVYAIEAALLAGFMVSATAFTVVLESPGSAVHAALPSPLLRRALMGIAMGATGIVLTYSRWGARSGAHLNPAVTLAFTRLGKMRPFDALAYMVSQLAGGIAGVLMARALFGPVVTHPAVNWVATLPGPGGAAPAVAAEFAMTAVLFGTILAVSHHPRLHAFTGISAAAWVAFFITVEAPISGMSLNPARSFGPAVVSGHFASLWIYFTAPVAGMALAAEVFIRTRGRTTACPSLHHGPSCRFCSAKEIA